jgi:methyltransferase (TIGR00027 family)
VSLRSESDSWDLATSVGATATMVAAQRALASDAGLIDDPFAAPLVRAVGIDVYTRLVNGEIPVDDQTEFDPSRMGRGMAVRTRFYDNFFLDATRGGIRQAVIVAAGLDARTYRLPWPEGTVVYEVDMPECDRVQNLDAAQARCRADGRAPNRRRRFARRLARGTTGRRLRSAGPVGMERRRSGGLPAARSPGRAFRQHHRAECAAESAGL